MRYHRDLTQPGSHKIARHISMKRKLLIATVATGLAALSITSFAKAQAEASTQVKIASAAHRENGCSESSKGFKVAIPNPEKLDLNYKGVLAGIERVYTEANGTRSDSDYAFADNGASLTFRLFAKGGGTRISAFGTNVCTKASGANIAIVLIAHYRP
jgi:hypothetical protein